MIIYLTFATDCIFSSSSSSSLECNAISILCRPIFHSSLSLSLSFSSSLCLIPIQPNKSIVHSISLFLSPSPSPQPNPTFLTFLPLRTHCVIYKSHSLCHTRCCCCASTTAIT